jgi:radical SAM protein (TIGR01212 family)
MKHRYNSINDHLKKRFGQRVYKVILETGCGCPNRDGTLGTAGCVFCNEKGYNPATNVESLGPLQPIEEQLSEGVEYVKRRHGVSKFISYFQKGSNTYGPLDKLERIYEDAIEHPDVVGLAISTRPDCISDSLLDVLEGLSKKTMLWVELGLQSAHDNTLTLINRGHGVDHFVKANEELAKRGVPVCAHVILGLPGESKEDMIQTAGFLNEHKVWGVKLHNLHILKDTALAGMYESGQIESLSLERYAELVADFLEHLSPEILIHRVNSHSPRSITIAPKWSINKLAIFNAVEAELEKRNTKQGNLVSGHHL